MPFQKHNFWPIFDSFESAATDNQRLAALRKVLALHPGSGGSKTVRRFPGGQEEDFCGANGLGSVALEFSAPEEAAALEKEFDLFEVVQTAHDSAHSASRPLSAMRISRCASGKGQGSCRRRGRGWFRHIYGRWAGFPGWTLPCERCLRPSRVSFFQASAARSLPETKSRWSTLR